MKKVMLALVFVVVSIACVAFFILHHEDGDARVVFNLKNTHGEAVSQNDLLGRYSIIVFGFTSCPDICPSHAAEVAKSLKVLETRSLKSNTDNPVPVQAIFISVDFERDTAEGLNSYLSYFHSDYIGYLGSRPQLDLAVDAFDGFYSVTKENSSGGEIVNVEHSSLIYITDLNGRVQKQLPFGVSGDEIADEIEALL